MGVRLFLLYGIVILAGWLLMLGLTAFRLGDAVQRSIDAWGQGAAQQLAQATLDPVMQGDAVALQAHLGRFARAPGIVSVAVYDINNSLLAQVGDSPREYQQRPGIHSFPASLGLGENLVGRVNVVIDATHIERLQHEIYLILAGGAALSLLLAVLASRNLSRRCRALHREASAAFVKAMPPAILPASLQEAGPTPLLTGDAFHQTLDALGEYVQQLQSPAPAQLLAAAADLMNPADACAYVMVEVRRLDVLQKQVSRDRLRMMLDAFLQHVDHTARLYSAQRVPVAGSCVKLLFPAPGNQEHAAFQALCCAYVLSGLLRDCIDPEWGISLHWSIAVDWHEAARNELLRNQQRAIDEQRSHWLGDQVAAGQVAYSAALVARLERAESRIQLTETPGTGGTLFYRLGKLSDTQRKMLDRQVAQLQEL